MRRGFGGGDLVGVIDRDCRLGGNSTTGCSGEEPLGTSAAHAAIPVLRDVSSSVRVSLDERQNGLGRLL